LKHPEALYRKHWKAGRAWSGFSSEIETTSITLMLFLLLGVARGAASRLRLKLVASLLESMNCCCRAWSGFSSEIETARTCPFPLPRTSSRVERLLV